MPPRLCEICGERNAMFLCQSCGSSVCPVCRVGWLCRRCGATEELSHEGLEPVKFGGVPLVFISLVVVLAGFAVVIAGLLTGGEAGGGCFVWPLPFIVGCGFGSDSGVFGVFLGITLAFSVLFLWFLSARWSRLPS